MEQNDGHTGLQARNVLDVLINQPRVSKIRATAIETRSLPVREQFDFWRDRSATVGVHERPGRAGGAFDGAAYNYFTPTLAYVRHWVNGPSSVNRTDRHIADSQLDGVLVQLRLGGLEIANNFASGRLFHGGDIRITDLQQPMFSENLYHSNIGLIVRKADLTDRVSGLERLHGTVLADTAMASLLKAHLASVAEVLPRLSTGEIEWLAHVTNDMLCAALSGVAVPGSLEGDDLDGPVLSAVRLCIDRYLHDPHLSPERIARSVGVSTRKLFRVCRPFGSPMELVRRRRLRRAMRMLEAGRPATVTEVAFAVGFHSRETFSRAFRAEFGLTPRDVLRLSHKEPGGGALR